MNAPKVKPLFRLRARLRKPWVSAATALRHRWAYPLDLAGHALSFALFVFIFSRLWAVACGDRGSLGGYTQAELTWYFIAAELLVFGQGGAPFRNLSRDIVSGQIAYTLARPRSYPVAAWAESLASSAGAVVFFLPVGLVVGGLTLGVVGIPQIDRTLVLLVSYGLAFTLNFLCQFALALSAFWTEENAAFLWIHQKLALVLGTFLPLEFFPQLWRPWIEATPYAWLAYPPARIWAAAEPSEYLRLLAGQALWVAILAAVVAGLFALGRRRTAVQGG